MIRHVVLVRFKPGTTDNDIASVFDDLERLRDVVPGMGSFAAGASVSPEKLERGFTHAFSIDFSSTVARNTYLDHPRHKAAGARLVAAAEGGLDGLLVFDLPLGGGTHGQSGAGTQDSAEH